MEISNLCFSIGLPLNGFIGIPLSHLHLDWVVVCNSSLSLWLCKFLVFGKEISSFLCAFLFHPLYWSLVLIKKKSYGLFIWLVPGKLFLLIIGGDGLTFGLNSRLLRLGIEMIDQLHFFKIQRDYWDPVNE